MRRSLRIVVCIAAAWLVAPGAIASPPELISYQGVLLLSDGTVVQDGLYTLQFDVRDAEQGGNPVFFQQLDVQVTDGLYNVILSNQGGWVLSDAFQGSPRYMEVTIAAGPPPLSTPVVLTPRQQIASVPYALGSAGAGAAGTQVFSSFDANPATISNVLSEDYTLQVPVPTTGDWLIEVHTISQLEHNPSATQYGARLTRQKNQDPEETVLDLYGSFANTNRMNNPLNGLHVTAPESGATYTYRLKHVVNTSTADLNPSYVIVSGTTLQMGSGIIAFLRPRLD